MNISSPVKRDNRRVIKDSDTTAQFYSVEEIVARDYNLDLCGYPSREEEILTPLEIIHDFKSRRATFNSKMDARLEKISALLEM